MCGTHTLAQTKVIDGGIPLLRSAVFRWYADKKANDPADTIYQLQDLTPPMLLSKARSSIASKAAETGTFLECARDLVRRHAARLGSQGTALVALGDELVQMRTIMRQGQRTLPREHGLEMVRTPGVSGIRSSTFCCTSRCDVLRQGQSAIRDDLFR